jgi:hypothetical protein
MCMGMCIQSRALGIYIYIEDMLKKGVLRKHKETKITHNDISIYLIYTHPMFLGDLIQILTTLF